MRLNWVVMGSARRVYSLARVNIEAACLAGLAGGGSGWVGGPGAGLAGVGLGLWAGERAGGRG